MHRFTFLLKWVVPVMAWLALVCCCLFQACCLRYKISGFAQVMLVVQNDQRLMMWPFLCLFFCHYIRY